MEARITIGYKAGDGEIASCTLEGDNTNNVSKNNYSDKLIKAQLNKQTGIYVSPKKEGPVDDKDKYQYQFVSDSRCGVFGEEGYNGYNSKWFSGNEPKTNAPFADYYDFNDNERPIFKITAAEGKSISKFLVVFDDLREEYAPRMTIKVDESEDEEVENQQSIFIHTFQEPVSKFSLVIKSWSKPCSMAKISKISTYLNREYDASEIISFTAGRENRSSHDKLELGLSSQYGDLTLLNAGDEFRTLSENDLLQDGLDVSVEMERDGTYIPLGCYKTQSWDLKVNEASVKVQLTDMLERLNSIKLNMFNLKEIDHVWSDSDVNVVEAVDKLLKIGGLDMDVTFKDNAAQRHAKEIIIDDMYFEKGTVFEMLKRVLQSAKMRLYVDVQKEEKTDKLKPVVVLYKMY